MTEPKCKYDSEGRLKEFVVGLTRAELVQSVRKEIDFFLSIGADETAEAVRKHWG